MPVLRELQGIIAKTIGLADVLRDALAALRAEIAVAFVYGSVASSRERASSDVDLVVVGSLGLSKLSPALETAEERLSRPVNARIYTADEFASKLIHKNHFLCAVLDKEKLFIVGGPDDLARVARRRPR